MSPFSESLRESSSGERIFRKMDQFGQRISAQAVTLPRLLLEERGRFVEMVYVLMKAPGL
jgi:hypothetical protein